MPDSRQRALGPAVPLTKAEGAFLCARRGRRAGRRLLEQARDGIRGGALADDRAVLQDLGCSGRFRGAGTVTAAAAAYLAARHAAQPAQGVLRAAFEPDADTDTLAAMTGALLGCLVGVDWLPAPWRDVQDAGYLRALAGRVAAGPSGVERWPVETPGAFRDVLTDLARNGHHEDALGESTRVQATPLPNPKSLSKSISARAWRLRTPEGQTMYVTRVDRPRAGRTDSHGGHEVDDTPRNDLHSTNSATRAARSRRLSREHSKEDDAH